MIVLIVLTLCTLLVRVSAHSGESPFISEYLEAEISPSFLASIYVRIQCDGQNLSLRQSPRCTYQEHELLYVVVSQSSRLSPPTRGFLRVACWQTSYSRNRL